MDLVGGACGGGRGKNPGNGVGSGIAVWSGAVPTPKVRLEVGDFSLVRKLVGKGGAALLAFDPPYNLGKNYDGVGGGDRRPLVEYRKLAFEVCRMGVEVAGGRMALVVSRGVLPIRVTALQMAGLDAQVVVVLKRAQGVRQEGILAQ